MGALSTIIAGLLDRHIRVCLRPRNPSLLLENGSSRFHKRRSYAKNTTLDIVRRNMHMHSIAISQTEYVRRFIGSRSS